MELDLLRCSFCGKSQEEIKLIAGPGVYICHECVDACNGIVEAAVPSWRWRRTSAPGPAGQLPWPEQTVQHRDAGECSFCRKPRKELVALVPGPGVSICDSCLDVASDVMEEELGPAWAWHAAYAWTNEDPEEVLRVRFGRIRSLRQTRTEGDDPYPYLSTQESEVVERFAAGKTTFQIALGFQISPHVVMTHLRRALQKLEHPQP